MVVVVSLLLAGASVWVLYSRLDDRQMDELVRRLESVWQFGADTIRLTFTDRMQGDDKNSRENAAFNVAPKGTLEADAPVVLVAKFEDFVPEVYDEVLPVAPARTMDPTWNPGADDKSPES